MSEERKNLQNNSNNEEKEERPPLPDRDITKPGKGIFNDQSDSNAETQE